MDVQSSVLANDFLEAEVIRQSGTVLCRAKKTYITTEAFKSFFKDLGSIIAEVGASKLIFDKTSLSVFDQEAMEWYHTHWKEDMLTKGLKHHRKILPNDPLFETSVKIGRQKILENNPNFDFDKFDIQYCDSVEEAMSK